MFYQSVRIFTHTEEISLLLGGFYLSATVRTFAVHQLALCPEGLTGRTIHAFIGSFVNISLIIKTLKNLLYLFFMIFIGGTDKFVIRNIQHIAHAPDYPRHIIHKFFGSHAGFLCFQFNLLSMLICPGLKENVIAFLSLKPGNAVRQHDFIVVADVRLTGGVSDGCR